MTVNEFVKQLGMVDPAVSVLSRRVEDALLEHFPSLNIDAPVQSYRRYGYALANYVAQRFWSDCCKHHGLDSSVFNRFRARVFNSGMSAITSTIEAFNLSAGDTVIHHRDCYFATTAYLQILRRRGVTVHSVDICNLENVRTLVSASVRGRTIIVTESVTNHIRMITAPLSNLTELAASSQAYLVIDNSLPGACQIDPTIFCFGSDHVVYVESLTKYYHTDESGMRSIGVAIFPATLRERMDHVIAVFGFYLQLQETLALPHKLFDVGTARIARIANTVRVLTGHIANQQQRRQLPFAISIPGPYRQWPGVTPWPGVIFIRLEAHGKCSAAQCVARLLSETNFPERGSFGHRTTTVLPIGLRWNDVDDGIVRIAVGSDDPIDELRNAFERFFNHYR